MVQMTSSELLFYGGIALMALSMAAAAVTAVVLRMSGKRLRARLEQDYGKKRH